MNSGGKARCSFHICNYMLIDFSEWIQIGIAEFHFKGYVFDWYTRKLNKRKIFKRNYLNHFNFQKHDYITKNKGQSEKIQKCI